MEQITIAGKVLNVPTRYEEGHELTAGEASALNQTYHENLRNNFAKRVKELADAGHAEADIQAELDKYAEEYAFGVRTGGGAVRDPVMAEAMNIAKSQIRAALRKKGVKITDVAASAITEASKKLLSGEKGAPILELAKQRVAEAQSAASADLDELVSSLPTKPAPAAAA